MNINVFAKFDDIPSLPIQVIKEKSKCRGLRITKGNNSKRIGPGPYFSIINVHLVDINVLAKFYEIPSLPLQDIENPKRRGRTDGRTNGLRENSIPPPPTITVCGGIKMINSRIAYILKSKHFATFQLHT